MVSALTCAEDSVDLTACACVAALFYIPAPQHCRPEGTLKGAMAESNFHVAQRKLAQDPSIHLSKLPRVCFLSFLWLKRVSEG